MTDDKKAIDTIADAMLDGTEEEKASHRSDPPLSTTNRSAYGDRYTSSAPRPYGRQVSRRVQVPYTRPTYREQAVAKSQAARGALRSRSAPLEIKDIDAVDLEMLMRGISRAIGDFVEWNNDWILLGEAEAMMFQTVVNTEIKHAVRAALVKVMMKDLMRIDPERSHDA